MRALAFCVLVAAGLAEAGGARAQDIGAAIAAGKPILQERIRYENVDQGNFGRDAEALTLRSRFGWETGAWNHLTGLIEGEATSHLGAEHFNDGLNHQTLYPGIGDPETLELHRLQLTWAPSKAFTAVIGRQKINIDDQRFIASSTWRQDEQAFDAIRLDSTVGRFSGTYFYINRYDRNVAHAADYRSNSHGLTVTYAAAPALKVEGFIYAVDLKESPTGSTLTEGVRITGQQALPAFKLAYAASYASQRNYAANPASYDLPYWMGEVSASRGPYLVKANYDSLGSDGRHGVSTPLGSVHLYQGWADAFTTTPARGINDFNLSATYSPSFRWGSLSAPQFFLRHHDFSYASGTGGLGTEWDAYAQIGLTKQLTGLIKYADYHGTAAVPGRRKLWLQLDFNL